MHTPMFKPQQLSLQHAWSEEQIVYCQYLERVEHTTLSSSFPPVLPLHPTFPIACNSLTTLQSGFYCNSSESLGPCIMDFFWVTKSCFLIIGMIRKEKEKTHQLQRETIPLFWHFSRLETWDNPLSSICFGRALF